METKIYLSIANFKIEYPVVLPLNTEIFFENKYYKVINISVIIQIVNEQTISQYKPSYKSNSAIEMTCMLSR